MRRTPGTPDKKLAMLRGIDEASLPHLVADILYFCRGHRSVTVVDGPGDGRRDISSKTSDGTKHVTQCKFHGDVTAAVGARETDELPVALLKFGCKSGLFVTTARLSPQSKREYLGDFPEFELECWDGLQLVDQVLSSPLLTELWLHEDSVQRRAVSVAVPFIVRRAVDDRPVHVGTSPFATPEYSVDFRSVCTSTSVFAPYRPPRIVDSSESGGETILCKEALITGSLDFKGLSPLLTGIVDTIAASVPRGATHTIRLGRPSLVPLQPAEPTETEDGDRLLVHGESGRSFVVAPDGDVHDEYHWVVPQSPACAFPRNLSVAEADWAGWYNADNDCMVMEEVSWPAAEVPYPYQLIGVAREPFLGKSVFSLTTESQAGAIRDAGIPEPDIAVQVLNDIALSAWLHPAITEATPVFERDPATGEMVMRPSARWECGEAALARVRDMLASLQVEEMTASSASELAKAHGENLTGVPTMLDVRSAELCCNFDSLASPINLAGRILLHVQMWEVPVTPGEAEATLGSLKQEIAPGFVVHWQAKRGHSTGATFVMSSLQVPCPLERPTTACILTEEAVDALASVQRHVRKLWHTSRRATLDFWTREVGFRFEDGRLVGNPFLVSDGVRYNIDTDDPDPDR